MELSDRTRRPSAALIVAAIALVLAMTGASVAQDPAAKLTKSKVKRIADKRIAKAAPGLTVARAANADSAASAASAQSAVSAENVGGARIVLVSHRSAAPVTDVVIGALNGLTLRVSCNGAADETLSATTNVSDSEIGGISDDASENDATAASTARGQEDEFDAGDTFVLNDGITQTDRIYQFVYSGGDGRNVSGLLATEDEIGSNDCIVSGHMIG